MADIAKTSVLLVEIGPDAVRVPALAPTKIGHWKGLLHRRSPNNPAGSEWKTSDIKLNLKEQTKYKNELLAVLDVFFRKIKKVREPIKSGSSIINFAKNCHLLLNRFENYYNKGSFYNFSQELAS